LRKRLLTEQLQTSQVVKKLFSELMWIEKVEYIDIEFIPTPISDYTNDRSAFDAMIITSDEKGKKGLIAIETKYTDLLGSNTSSKKNDEIKNELISSNRIFDDSYSTQLKKSGYKQIDRNYLLTYAYAKKNNFKHFTNVIISPEADKLTIEEINTLQASLVKNKDTVFKISLEEFVQRGQSCIQVWFVDLMKKFHKRYLDWK
jgi:hypothetical protein